MSKRFLSLLMALILCFSTLPSAALAETAAEKTQNYENTADVYTVGEDTVVHSGESGEAAVHTNHPICGDEDCTENDHKLPDNAEWVGVSTLDNYMAAGYYYLTNDVNLSDPWSPINNVTLCLNGKIITASSFADVIDMRAGKTITLCDCDTQGRGAVISDHRDGVGVYLNESTLNLYSGTITGTKYGVHLAQDNSTFNMHGGSIKNSSTGVYMKARPNITNVFNMTGGTISGNGTGSEDVGGVYVYGTFHMSGNAKITNNTKSERIIGVGGVYVIGGTFEMSGDAEISGNSVTIKEGNRNFTSAGTGGVYVKGGAFKMSGNAKVTGNTVTNNSTKDMSGGVYVDASGAMTVSGNASVSGNTDGNVYLTEGKSIAIDGNLGETAAIGVRIPAIADGSSATVATGAKETDLNRFSDDSGNNYTKKFADGNIIFASGEPHEHQICGDNNCTESGHGSALFSALNALSKTAAGAYELPEGNWYLTKNLNLDATLCITGNTQLCLNGYSITATAAVDAIELANGSALTLCDCNGSGKNNGIITHGADADGTQYNGRGIFSNGSFTMYSGKICGNSLSGVGDQYNTTSMKGAGGGVCVTSGVFTMYGGEISGNTLSGDYNKGAGVYVKRDATFTMTGGTVNDNIIKSGNSIQGAGICNQGTTTVGGTAEIRENQMTRIDDVTREYDKDGGGIYTGGTLIVEGNAKIIKNQTAVKGVLNSHGGGIYVSNGTAVLRGNAEVKDNEVGSYGAGICCIGKLSVSDNVQITGNEEVYSYGGRKTSNVYFTDADSMPIAVNGALTDSACIGVLLRDKLLPTETNTVTIAQADTETSADTSNRIKAGNFTSDNNKYVINMTDNGSKAVLSKHEHTWTYSSSTTITENDTITAECSECSKNGGSVTIKAPSHTVYGDGKAANATLEEMNWALSTNKTVDIRYWKDTISESTYLGNGDSMAPVDAGNYIATYAFGTVEARISYTVDKATPKAGDFIFTPPENLTYNGEDKPADIMTAAGVSGMGKIGICHYSKSGEMVRPNDAGTYTVKINIAEGKNYAAATGLTAGGWNFTINPREVTLTWNNTENRTYGDGKTVTATAGNLVNGDEISVDVTDGDKNEIGTHTATATGLIGGKAGNYKLPDDNTKRTATYNVNKGRLELDNKELTMPVYKGVAKRYTYDFANELPTLTDGLTFGNIRYIGTLSDDFDEHWINKGCVELNGSVLSINTSDWDEGTQILEYVVTVKSDNYEDFTMTLKVNAEDKKMADLSIEINGWSYGSGDFNEPVVLNEPADAKWVSTVYKNKATGKEITPNGKTDDAGEYTVTVRYESDDTVYTGTKDFIIKPRHLDQNAVVVPAGVTANKIYDGTTVSNLTEMSIAKNRLVTEEDGALRIGGTSEYVNSNAGATRLAFTTDGTIRLSDSSSSAKPSNYSTTPPTFTAFFAANILQRELDFTADSVSKIYGSDDAAAEVAVSFLPVSGKDKTGLVDGETLAQGVDYDVTAVFSKTEVGEDNNVRVTVTLKDTQKARNYTLNTSEIIVTGTINPKPTPVLDGNVTLSPDKITYGEPLSNIKITGTMKDPITNATVDGTFSWQLPGDTILDASTLGHNVGWKFTPKDGRTYAEVTDIATVKVDKATQYGEVSMAGYTYGQTPGTPTLTDRTGDMNAQVTYYCISVDGGTPQTWNINNPPTLNAGTYHMYARIGDTNNYYGFEAVYCEFTVAKATPTYTKPTGLTAKYGQNLRDITLTNPEGNTPGTWSWQAQDTALKSIGVQKYYADFKPVDTNNYLEVADVEIDVTVGKADGNNLKTEELTQKYTDTSEHTYIPDWSGLPMGQNWSYNSEYSVSTDSTAELTPHDFAANGSLLTYAVSGGKAGDVITVTLKASCDIYEDFTICQGFFRIFFKKNFKKHSYE